MPINNNTYVATALHPWLLWQTWVFCSVWMAGLSMGLIPLATFGYIWGCFPPLQSLVVWLSLQCAPQHREPMSCTLSQGWEAVFKICHLVSTSKPSFLQKSCFSSWMQFPDMHTTPYHASLLQVTRDPEAAEVVAQLSCVVLPAQSSVILFAWCGQEGSRAHGRTLASLNLWNSSSPPHWSLQLDTCVGFFSLPHGFKRKQVKGANGFYISVLE